jgi:hypothetical protein
MIKLTFKCGGCAAEATTEAKSAHFDSVNGRGWGFGRWAYPTIAECAPEGWIAYDPYTQGQYCPECWDEIDSSLPASEVENDPTT